MALTAPTTLEIPGYVAGTWQIDPVHSDVSFSVRHMMVSKVRGTFHTFGGTITTADDPLDSSVQASVDLASLDTKNTDRDAHIRSADFFDVANHPTMEFTSTGLHAGDGGFVLDGTLKLHGIARPVSLDLEVNGFSPDPYGGTRAGFTATTDLSRADYGIEFNIPMDGGGVVIGDKIHVVIEIEAVLEK